MVPIKNRPRFKNKFQRCPSRDRKEILRIARGLVGGGVFSVLL
jgi:hypothetical protein